MTTPPGLPTLAALATAARLAGDRIQEWADGRAVPTTAKADLSPVTAADLAAQAALLPALAALLPGVPVISEEGEGVDDQARTAGLVATLPLCWLIDPLDGTRDFLARTGDYTVNIALMACGRPILGCVLAPARGICWLGGEGLGAFRQAVPDGALVPVRTRAADPECFVCLVSRHHGGGEAELLRRGFPDCRIEAAGSALKYALLAEGAADVAVRLTPTCLWDTAAAQCVLEAAGGAILGFDGRPLGYTGGTLINPGFIALGDRAFDWRRCVRAVKG